MKLSYINDIQIHNFSAITAIYEGIVGETLFAAVILKHYMAERKYFSFICIYLFL